VAKLLGKKCNILHIFSSPLQIISVVSFDSDRDPDPVHNFVLHFEVAQIINVASFDFKRNPAPVHKIDIVKVA
jgi:hypothetical protein